MRTRTRPERRLPDLLVFNHTSQLSGGEIALLTLLTEGVADRTTVVVDRSGPLQERLDALEHVRCVIGSGGGPDPLARAAGRSVPLAVAKRLLDMRRTYRDALVTSDASVVVFNTARSALVGATLPRRGRCFVYLVRDRLTVDSFGGVGAALIRLAASRYDALICNSESTLSTIPRRPRRRTVIPSPVARAFYRPRPSRFGGPVEILMVGRITPWKGQLQFVQALAALPRPATVAWRARIVGAPLFGEQSYAEEVARAVREAGLADRVSLSGHRSDVAELMAGSDIVVHTSVAPEPFGQVVVQGMASGCAVVAADAGGPVEAIEDGVNGLLVDPTDVRALSGAIGRLVEDEGLRDRLGKAAAHRALAFAVGEVASLTRAHLADLAKQAA